MQRKEIEMGLFKHTTKTTCVAASSGSQFFLEKNNFFNSCS